MAWIRSEQGLKNNPKLLKFMEITKLNKLEAIGLLHSFWWWVLSYAEDGDLSKFNGRINMDDIYIECDLYESLKLSGFIDSNDIVHDWLEYALKFLQTKYHSSNPEKLQSIVDRNRKALGKPLGTPKMTNGRTEKTYNIKDTKLPEIIKYICERYKEKFKIKYPFNGIIHSSIIKQMCKKYGHDEIKKFWDIYLRLDDPFIQKCGYSINLFSKSIEKCIYYIHKENKW